MIYTLEDLREYFKILGEVNYCTPQHGQRIFHTFLHLRFTGDEEREHVLGELAKVETTGKEAEGWHHANFYLSRPAEEAETTIEPLLASDF